MRHLLSVALPLLQHPHTYRGAFPLATIAHFSDTAGHNIADFTLRGDGIAYPGGKGGSGTYQKIINRIPPHTTYIEPFLGGGSIMRHKRPALLNIGVDLDAEVIAHWQACTAASADSRSTAGIPGNGGRWAFTIGDGTQFLRSYPFSGGELVYCDPP